jgi:integrase
VILDGGEELQIAAIGGHQQFLQSRQAIDCFLHSRVLLFLPPIPMFYLAVVLEKGDVVDSGLDAQDQPEFVDLRAYFGDRKLTEIDERAVVEYRNYRHRQPSKRDPKRTVKGATVNRELECLHCIFEFAFKRKYIGGNPASDVKHFDERHERPTKRMLTAEDEHRILEAAPPHLRVAIVLLVQTGGRTYSEGLSLKWDQVDLLHGVLHLDGSLKTTDSAQPLPLSRLACDVLTEWKKEQGSETLYVFPSPRSPGKPIRSVKRAWRAALNKAGVSYFPIYNLRHVFCTRLSWVAPDAVVQRAMRHSSPETKRRYQLGMVDQVREGIERANEQAYQGEKVLRFHYGAVKPEKQAAQKSVSG